MAPLQGNKLQWNDLRSLELLVLLSATLDVLWLAFGESGSVYSTNAAAGPILSSSGQKHNSYSLTRQQCEYNQEHPPADLNAMVGPSYVLHTTHPYVYDCCVTLFPTALHSPLA